MKKILQIHAVTFLLLLCWGFASAQTVTGKVVSDTDGAPIPGVSVVLKGTTVGTTTDTEGNFALDGSEVLNGTLVFSFIGFTSQEVAVQNQTVINVTLAEDITTLNEVVVTALNIEREKKALNSGVSVVSGAELTQARSNNLVNGLVGRVAGLNVTSTATGAAGSSRVVIRGNTSISGNNQPLYVVDGIPIDNQVRQSAGEWGGRDAGDGIQMLNPDEIESITVLKGGSAAALYGFRASNGVILITTKQGSKSKGLGIEFNSNLVFEEPLELADWQTVYGHGSLGVPPANAAAAAGLNLNSWGGLLDGSMVPQFDGVERPYVAHKNNLKNFYNTGTNFTNALSLSGSTDKMSYNFSMSDLNNKSVVPNSTLRRNSFSLNATLKPVEKLTLNVSVRYLRERVKNRPRLSDSPGNANFTMNLLPNSIDVRTLKESMTDDFGFEKAFNANVFVTNPYWATEMFNQHDERDRIVGVVMGKYDLTKWLYVRGKIGTDQYTRSNFEITPFGTRYVQTGEINDQSTSKFREFNGEWLVGANKEFGNINVDAFVGGNLMIQKDETMKWWGNTFFGPGFYHITNLQNKNNDFSVLEKKVTSVFGSVELSYKRYLYLTATARNDWFSTLPRENWDILYPSVGASFVLSDAVQLPAAISFAKIFGSYAKVGGDRDPYGLTLPYLYRNPHGAAPVADIDNDPSTIPNANLKPYETTTLEAGFETRLLENRIGLEFSVYQKTTENDIISSQISNSTGYGSVLLNVGEVSNKGIELLLNATPLKLNNFSWDVSFNVAHNASKVVKISDDLKVFRVATAAGSRRANIDHLEGKAFGQVMAFRPLKNEQGQYILNNGVLQSEPTQTAHGTGVPPVTMGLMNEFRYKGFGLSVLIDGKFGAVMYSGTNDFAKYRGAHKATLRGREEGIIEAGVDGNGVPNATSVTSQTYFQSAHLNITGLDVYDADFIKLRQIILSYALPGNIVAKTPFQGISVSLVGRNLGILMKHVPNVDPESSYNNTNGQGLEFFGAPTVRSYGFNVNLKL
ncbi:MAG TPA: SusC/RagA family TonB-linked outer membrane protein [Ohtaekwangia sp.]|nr:SusC/RagA family TonB-linked outer membrane protein [Ohtaekwangia sp.]